MAIRYFCSDGTRVTQAMIDKKYLQSRINRYSDHVPYCWGCGEAAQGNAHIIAQARCKVLHKTELIWDTRNYFPACNACNSAIENPKGEEWKNLKNIDYCLKWIKQEDPELFTKFSLNS